jgi:hypothetical protein
VRLTLSALVFVLAAGCAHRPPPEAPDVRLSSLKRAAQYPWTDDGRCAVREASNGWNVLVERCYGALDLKRIRFHDLHHVCGVASVDAATLGPAVGMCLLVQPEILVGVVVVIGVVIVAEAIAEELRAAKKSCFCRCLGVPEPRKNPDPLWGKGLVGIVPYDAECRAECVSRAFPSYQCT